MVFQSYALYPHMNVRENMAFGLKLARVDRAEIDPKVNQAAELLELTELLDRKPANLSGGQRQRVAMGRAIVRSPQAFLMDEPSPTSTPSCASRCGPPWPGCRTSWAPPPSTSPTTRPRP
jgi:ABC-type sugar transport system ATPase subunit